MRKSAIAFLAVALIALLIQTACTHRGDRRPQQSAVDYATVSTPEFNADSAYAYVAAQVAFGPRIPGSAAHRRCAEYLTAQLRQWCDTVVQQPFTATLWDGSQAEGVNIIASLHPEQSRRILLAAHWDSRLWADHDPDSNHHRQPILGANDGASGVAMILELARVMQHMPPSVGIDFILFDLEDQGTPEWGSSQDANSWCKGSQHWARHLHQPYYSALYGVLFDMVGSKQPRFTYEDISREYAGGTLTKYWNTAAALGYANIFVGQYTDPILDDHYYINALAHIPTIDIVQNTPGRSFFEHWHTMGDNLDCIDRETLAIVARVTLKTIYGDFPYSDNTTVATGQ